MSDPEVAMDPDPWSKTWTYFQGEWHEGNVLIFGPRSHAAWLGSMVDRKSVV